MYIKGKKFDWEYVIGLEVHAQISTKSKLFSNASTKFGSKPNSQVEYQDIAMPGILPVLNKTCIEKAVKTGIGLNAKINLFSVFDRKNYFYHDLPNGYQISQFYIPIVQNGFINITDEKGKQKKIIIDRLHIEQDAGKSIHQENKNFTLIDFNRSGIPLMEIVTAPNIYSPFQASEYIKNLRKILMYLETCDGDMEKGSLRCDANVSVKKIGDTNLGQRCEIKNLNSISNIVKAIEVEAKRQIDLIESGEKIVQQTLSFNEIENITIPLRKKENCQDYKYFPDPDLPPVIITQDYVDKIANNLPELPEKKLLRYQQKYNLSKIDAINLTSNKNTSTYFEKLIEIGINPHKSASWILTNLFALLKKKNTDISNCKISPQKLASIINLINKGYISNKSGKIILESVFEGNQKDPIDIAKEKDLVQISNAKEIESIIKKVISSEKKAVAEYLSGKTKVFNFIFSQIIKLTRGKANPEITKSLLIEKLKK